MKTMLDGSPVPTPQQIARRLPRNQAKRGDTIVYRDPTTTLINEMLVEDVTGASDRINVVYLGSAKRTIHSRHVLEVRHA